MKPEDLYYPVDELTGYTLELVCIGCGLKRQVEHFPTAGAPPLGALLTHEHRAITQGPCLRCKKIEFEVLTAPSVEKTVIPPVGWYRPS